MLNKCTRSALIIKIIADPDAIRRNKWYKWFNRPIQVIYSNNFECVVLSNAPPQSFIQSHYRWWHKLFWKTQLYDANWINFVLLLLLVSFHFFLLSCSRLLVWYEKIQKLFLMNWVSISISGWANRVKQNVYIVHTKINHKMATQNKTKRMFWFRFIFHGFVAEHNGHGSKRKRNILKTDFETKLN